MNNTQTVDINILGKQYNFLLWVLAEAYIEKVKKPSVKDLLSETGAKYIEGQLYGAHIIALQQMMIEEFQIIGFDLETEVNKTGEIFTFGKLSAYENKILSNKVLNLVSYTNKIKEIKENNPYQ